LEIIRIGENKLKLILSDEDLLKYHLKFESLDYDNTETRRVLWAILDEAKKKTGFDAAADRTLVQTYPGRKGGCEIYVTRQTDAHPAVGSNTFIYRFAQEESVFTVCRLLRMKREDYASALYRTADGFYYLALTPKETPHGKENLLSPLSFVEEYAQRIKSNGIFAYIKEHGTCLFSKDAAERLANFENQGISEQKTGMVKEKGKEILPCN